MIELKTYAGSNVTPQNDAIMNDTNTLNNGIYYGCNVTIKDATTLHINAGQGIVYGRLFEVLDSDIPVSLSPSGTLLGQLYVHIDLSNIAAPIQILVDTGETLADLEDDPQLNIDSGITDMQLATFTVSTVGMSDLVETFAEVEPIRAVLGDADISAIGDGTVKGSIRAINTQLSQLDMSLQNISYTGVSGWTPQTVVAKHRGNIGAIRTQSSITIIAADANIWHHILTLNECKPYANIYIEPYDGSTAEPSTVFTARIDADGKMWLRCTTPGTYTMIFEGTWLVG